MEKIISKEEIDILEKIEGEVIGSSLMTYLAFILKEEKEEGLKKVEDAMEKLGYKIRHKEINPRTFYPLRLGIILLVVIVKLFGYEEKKLNEMGQFQAKSSPMIRFLLRYFVSVKKFAEAIPKMWRRYFTVGEIEVPEYNEEKKYGVLRIKNFHIHPFICQTGAGYFSEILKMLVGKEVTYKETKCVHKGDEYHEYLLKW